MTDHLKLFVLAVSAGALFSISVTLGRIAQALESIIRLMH